MPDLSHVRKDYANERIVVHWDSSRCIHSANCLGALPEVFDTRRRPWVQVDRASADDVAAAVDRCPSRALTYSRLDGGAEGPNAVPVGEVVPPGPEDGVPVVVSLRPNGPLAVEGPVRIELSRGEVLEITDRAFLCRCGGSANKPFCDGTHKRTGFTAEGW
ncbi:MAG: (4Fe-4S)-binding protein [Acidimicrobiales bacterium]